MGFPDEATPSWASNDTLVGIQLPGDGNGASNWVQEQLSSSALYAPELVSVDEQSPLSVDERTVAQQELTAAQQANERELAKDSEEFDLRRILRAARRQLWRGRARQERAFGGQRFHSEDLPQYGGELTPVAEDEPSDPGLQVDALRIELASKREHAKVLEDTIRFMEEERLAAEAEMSQVRASIDEIRVEEMIRESVAAQEAEDDGRTKRAEAKRAEAQRQSMHPSASSSAAGPVNVVTSSSAAGPGAAAPPQRPCGATVGNHATAVGLFTARQSWTSPRLAAHGSQSTGALLSHGGSMTARPGPARRNAEAVAFTASATSAVGTVTGCAKSPATGGGIAGSAATGGSWQYPLAGGSLALPPAGAGSLCCAPSGGTVNLPPGASRFTSPQRATLSASPVRARPAAMSPLRGHAGLTMAMSPGTFGTASSPALLMPLSGRATPNVPSRAASPPQSPPIPRVAPTAQVVISVAGAAPQSARLSGNVAATPASTFGSLMRPMAPSSGSNSPVVPPHTARIARTPPVPQPSVATVSPAFHAGGSPSAVASSLPWAAVATGQSASASSLSSARTSPQQRLGASYLTPAASLQASPAASACRTVTQVPAASPLGSPMGRQLSPGRMVVTNSTPLRRQMQKSQGGSMALPPQGGSMALPPFAASQLFASPRLS